VQSEVGFNYRSQNKKRKQQIQSDRVLYTYTNNPTLTPSTTPAKTGVLNLFRLVLNCSRKLVDRKVMP
jgi:hypothetical protein